MQLGNNIDGGVLPPQMSDSLSCFYNLVTGWQPLSWIRIQATLLCTLFVHNYVINAHSPLCLWLCIITACLYVMCMLRKGLRYAFSPPAETCQLPWGTRSRFTGQLRKVWQLCSSRLEHGMPLCSLLPGQDLFPSCHFTSTSSTFN